MLWLGPCEEMIAQLDKGMIDLLCTDPPWSVAFKSNQGHHAPILNDGLGEYDATHAIYAAAKKFSRGASAYVFGPFGEMNEAPFIKAKATLIWDKVSTGMGDLRSPWYNQTEPIHFYQTGEKDDGRLAARRRQGNVLRVMRTTGKGANRHPTEKPVELWRMLIEASSLVGETVCDPYMGVGGCGVAAILAGRTFIGAELDPKFFEIAKQRIIAAEAWAKGAAGI